MSVSMSNYLEKYIRALVFGNQTWAGKPTTFYVSLHTADPTDATSAETLVASTEISGKGYSRISIACNNSNWTVARDTVTNALTISGGASATADWGTITHVGIYDAATRGNLLFFGALAESKAITQYGSASFEAGTIAIQLGSSWGTVYATKVLRYLFQAASWTNVSTFYFGLGTNADANQLYGEPIAIEGASATAYARGTQANTTAKWPASTSNASSTSIATAVANFVASTADWGTLSYQAILDAAIVTGKTYTQSTTTVTVASVAHGLGSTSTLPANTALGSLSGTYTISSTTVTVTLPVGHGFNTGDLICLTYAGGGSATSGRYTITASTATTVTVTDSGGGGSTPGTVTAQWPLYVDLWFLSTSAAYCTSKRYVVNAITSADAFTVVGDVSQTVTTSNVVYSAANLLLFASLTTPVVVNATDTTSIPASGITATVD
jgi:hypothetical protein